MRTLDNLITPEEVCSLIRAKADEYGGAVQAAPRWGVSFQMVFLVMKGKRRPTDEMLADIGVEKIEISYRKLVGEQNHEHTKDQVEH